jgi:hypothetical protein
MTLLPDERSSIPGMRKRGPPPPPPKKPPRGPKRPRGPPPPPAFADVQIRLPSSSPLKEEKPLELNHFELSLGGFKFDVGDLNATFQSFTIASAFAPVHVKVTTQSFITFDSVT